MTDKGGFGEDLEGNTRGLTETLRRHLHCGTENKQEKLQGC
jgi:hypothetical protein